MKKPYLVKEIIIIDSYHFKIVWNDDLFSLIKLADLQRCCPCNRCQTKTKAANAEEQLTARSLSNVGRFGIKVEFTRGCSSGIYPFSLLRSISGIKD